MASILHRLDERGLPNKTDIGWSDYDVEIYGSRWSHLQLTTVTEDHPGGRQLVRCRLDAVWSLPAKVTFASLLGLVLLNIGLLMNLNRFWPWLLLLILPLFVWFVARERRMLQSVMTVLLDELARQSGLLKVRSESGSKLPLVELK